MKVNPNYLGRLFTEQELSHEERQQAKQIPSMKKEKDQQYCQRCGSQIEEEWHLPIGAFYCRECLIMKRIRSDQNLYYFPQERFPQQDVLKWSGQLTPFQERVSQGLLQAVDKKEATLVHAVTGAGKTEMIYQVVAKVIDQGGAVCLASPRIDVCLELHKRLQNDFSCEIALLYGESDPYFRTPLVVATTHQLLKFYQAFDLLIVDEVDAFPYVDNPVLYHAVNNCVKETGLRIFLTATSTDELDRKVKQGELKRLSLPRRFHGNPLIVPKPIWLSNFNKYIEKNGLPPKLKLYIEKQRKTAYPLLIFASEIKKGEKLKEILQEKFPNEKIGFVSSITADRLEQVQAFRDGDLTILISTTILERGVTFPRVDVFVVEANHQLFTKSSLVQIGGRVGRSMDRPTGELIFFHDGLNLSIKKAIKEIKQMNQEAGV
ncbi:MULTISPECIES: DEAD/DEAH box helicase [Streptococcus]|uniref:DEAD/DEAH box helicase n=1 Tax=Streptococcus taonis TaxID=3041623 RepID=A0ABT6PEJ1_9STRE|nr:MULTISPECIES: DEAD/DEAH box helicase [unclassified Streptococcus]MDI1474407.1 DEAD/DEAH box helicase [Streptococcus sp. ST22-14]WNS72841.1 DEAD/DEAH box helicase [Streptococcus sp. DTU_2020_1001019_1_SI_AUS_MUR_006]